MALRDITTWEHSFNHKCYNNRLEKEDDSYYPRQVGEKGTLSRNDRSVQNKRQTLRTQLESEGSKKGFPGVGARERKISGIKRQLEPALQIIVAKDNDLERVDKQKQKL